MNKKGQEESEPSKKKDKEEIDDYNFIKQLRGDCLALGMIDPKYEKEKNLMKEVNAMDYLLNILEHCNKKKNQYYQLTISNIIYDFCQNKYHLQDEVNEQVKMFVTSLLYSYSKCSHKSLELNFIKRYFQEDSRKDASSINFYLRLRKTIVTNFLKETRKSLNTLLDGQQIKFEDWSTLVTRFLGANHIASIGTKVKDYNLKTKIYDKILENSIEACYFIEFCVEEYEKSLPPISQKYVKKNSQVEEQKEKVSEGALVMVQESPTNRQVYSPFAGTKRNIHEAKNQTQIQDSNANAQKIISQLQEQKYKLLDEKMKQTIVFNQTLKLHENLADNYNTLHSYTKDLQQVLAQLQHKMKKGQQFTEYDAKAIDQTLMFKEFLNEDPKQALLRTGVYDFVKGS